MYAFCREFGKMSQICVSRGVHPDYYDITKGGSLKFITILQGGGGGGSSRFITILQGGGGGLSGPQICIT